MQVAISGMMRLATNHHKTCAMNITEQTRKLQRWSTLQYELMPYLQDDVINLTPKLERLIHILDWVQIEEYTAEAKADTGRPEHVRAWLANAFVAKCVLGLSTTAGLIERLSIDRSLRRICGFTMTKVLPSEATFSRAFAQFAKSRLPERVHESLIKRNLGEVLIGHICRDGTAIHVREKPIFNKTAVADKEETKPKRRGRPRRNEVRPPAKESPIERQRKQTLREMLKEIPQACDRGAKCNAQGYKTSWNGYKLHLDTADCGVPIAALLSSASMHDSRAAVPLSLISAGRVTNLYDLMDAAYCSNELQAHSRSLNHVPLIDHNPRGGEKEEFEPADAMRYRTRTAAERANARMKDEFGARDIRVRGAGKVMCHLMFGVLVLAADQLMRLRR